MEVHQFRLWVFGCRRKRTEQTKVWSQTCVTFKCFMFFPALKVYLHTVTSFDFITLLLQTFPWSCASGSAALPSGSGKSCGEEDSVWILVLPHPWLPYWRSAPFNPPHNYIEGLLTKGSTHRNYFSSVFLMHYAVCCIWVIISVSRCGCVRSRCCRPYSMAPVSFWLRLKTRRRPEHPTPRSPSLWPQPSESCTEHSAWLCWPRPRLKHSPRS